MVGVVELRLKDLQVAHLEARGGEGHLKVHGDGWPAKTMVHNSLNHYAVFKPGPLFLRLGLQQLDFGGYLRFLHASHPLDLPHNRILARLVLRLALHADQLDTTRVQRGWDPVSHTTLRSTDQPTILPDLKLLGEEAGFEVGLDDNLDL